jgi:ATP-dependent DNA helicase RecG
LENYPKERYHSTNHYPKGYKSLPQKDTSTTQKNDNATQKDIDATPKKVLDYFKQHPKGTRIEAAEAIGDITADGVKFIIGGLF